MNPLSSWQFWVAAGLLLLGLIVTVTDRPFDADQRQTGEHFNRSLADAFSFGIQSEQDLEGVTFGSNPRLDLTLTGEDALEGIFWTGLAEDSAPSQGYFVVSLPADATVQGLVTSYDLGPNLAEQLREMSESTYPIMRVSIEPRLKMILDEDIPPGPAGIATAMANAVEQARHDRIVALVPIAPNVLGLQFDLERKGLSSRLGYGRRIYSVLYARPELLGLEGQAAAVSIPALASSTPSVRPGLELTLSSSVMGRFDSYAPQGELQGLNSMLWPISNLNSQRMEAVFVNDRTRLWVDFATNGLFLGVGVFIGSINWKDFRWRPNRTASA